MALVLADRVRDTTTTTGTGTVTLSGTAPTGYQNFSVIGNSNTTYYTINAGSQWEVGIGTYSSTGPTLARTTVLASSNSGSLVDFSTGTKDVFVTYPAERSVAEGYGLLPVANGGTGATTLSSGYLVKGNGTSAVSASVVYDNGTNVGIGTASPGSRLDVVAQDAIRATGFQPFLTLRDSSDANKGSRIQTASATTIFYNDTTGGGTYTERMRIDSSGNVGIGTSSPSTRLDVNSTVTLSGAENAQLRWLNSGKDWRANTSAGGNWYLYDATNNKFPFTIQGNAPSDAFYMTSAGNVGIGTSSPTTKLQIGDISAADATYQGRIKLEDTSASLQTIGGLEFATSAFGAGYGWKINSIDSSGVHLAFGTRQNSATWSEAMRIGSSGNLLVGTTVTEGPSKVSVVSTTSTTACISYRNSAGSGSTFAYFLNAANSAQIGSITNNADTGVLYNVTSDVRLKKNIADADSASNLIDALQVRKFDWRANDSHQRYGFVAQELLEVAPEAVHNPEDPDEMMAVDYSKLVPMLVKEIQSLRARVAQLEGN